MPGGFSKFDSSFENGRFLTKRFETTSIASVGPQQHFNQRFKDLAEFKKPKNLLMQDENLEMLNSHKQQKHRDLKEMRQYSNYSYLETLRSIQSPKKSYGQTTPRTTTAGTEFPIPEIVGDAELYNPLEDPYYPRNPTSTEAYYILATKNNLKAFASYTQRPWLSNVNLKIPDILPDFNSLEDIVDRRKHFFIPKSKHV